MRGGIGRRKRLPHRLQLGLRLALFLNFPNTRARLFIRFGLIVGQGEGFELLEGELVVALGGVDAALEALELAAADVEDTAFGVFVGVDAAGGFHGGEAPERSLGAAQSAKGPLAMDEGIDEGAALGGGSVEAVVVIGDQGFELGGIFASDDFGFRVNAGFQGVEADGGFTGAGAGPGGFLRVEAIGFELFE